MMPSFSRTRDKTEAGCVAVVGLANRAAVTRMAYGRRQAIPDKMASRSAAIAHQTRRKPKVVRILQTMSCRSAKRIAA